MAADAADVHSTHRADGRRPVARTNLDPAVEVHGAHHQQVGQWDADVTRGTEIVIAGRRLLVLTSYAIRHHPDVVARQLCRMFSPLGWRAA